MHSDAVSTVIVIAYYNTYDFLSFTVLNDYNMRFYCTHVYRLKNMF